jgi:putative tryptophan/tyrosine transport system substrate-binding protein
MPVTIRRRDLLAAIGGAAFVAWPLGARTQQPERMRRIGILLTFTEDHEGHSWINALVQRLQELGWTDGRNLHIDYRWEANESSRALVLAQELLKLQPDVIVACGGPAILAIAQATRSVPIVFLQVVDPISLGIVPNLAHPGGNITGFTHFELTIVGKWLQTLKDIAPSVIRCAVIFDPDNPASVVWLRAVETVVPKFGMQLTRTGVHGASEIERAVEAFAREPNGALIVLPNPVTQLHRELTIALAARYRLPAIYPYRFYTESGGLMSYGFDVPDMYRRSATYVDRILKGENPGELPVQAPIKFELVINLTTAKALGLSVPLIMQMTADDVIE